VEGTAVIVDDVVVSPAYQWWLVWNLQ